MRILHYTLGLPPYRSGGLTRYSVDLMMEQIKKDEVFLLFPGKNTLDKKFSIKAYGDYNKVKVFEMVNTLPIPLLGGVLKVDEFIKEINGAKEAIVEFLKEVKPDIIHIHTLMGLPKEFIDITNVLGIKTIFTTHDYYGLCPKVNFINCDGDLSKCESCNKNAYSMKMIRIMQSALYRRLKETTILKGLRKSTKKKVNSEPECIVKSNDSINKYSKFRRYYINMLEGISQIHFNSTVSKKVFKQFCNLDNGEIISITHGLIKDKREKKDFKSDRLNIVFLGPLEEYKGFKFLIDALKEIDYSKWKLEVYGNTYEVEVDAGMNVKFYGRYNYSDFKNIMRKNDVLIAPSIWNETFGFVLLEALSYGMPVITNKNVGASDIIKDGVTGFLNDGSIEKLREIIQGIINDNDILKEMNRNILKEKYIFSMEDHLHDIEKIYKNTLKGR